MGKGACGCWVPGTLGCFRVLEDWPSSLLPPPLQSSLRSSPCAPWGPNSAWSSRRSSWNSLGRAPSLKRRSQCGERESLLSGEGKGSAEEEAEDGRPRVGASPGTRATPLRRAGSLDQRGTLDAQPLRPATLLPTKLHDCNGQMLALPSEFFLRIDSHKEDPAEFDDDMEDVSGRRARPPSCPGLVPGAEPERHSWWGRGEGVLRRKGRTWAS